MDRLSRVSQLTSGGSEEMPLGNATAGTLVDWLTAMASNSFAVITTCVCVGVGRGGREGDGWRIALTNLKNAFSMV